MADNPIKYSDIVKEDDSLDKLIRKLDQTSDAYMNLYNNIKDNAIKVRTQIENLGTGMRSASKSIKDAANSTDDLTKAINANEKAYTQHAKDLESIRVATTEQNRINKLTAQLNASVAGSYNALSAEYSLLKIQINGLSQAERDEQESQNGLITRSRELYERMKELQAQTGKNQLNVGNYADANRSLITELRAATYELAQLQLAGEGSSERYTELVAKTALLKDAMLDASAAIKNAASDTAALDAALGAAAVGSGGLSVITGATTLFGIESENVQKAQRDLQAAIAITNGLTAIQNNLQKQSSLRLAINTLQLKAQTKAQTIKSAAEGKGIVVTTAATVAQKLFNLVASANPYVLLAVAIISVVGAFALFSAGANNARKAQEQLLAAQEAYTAALQRSNDAVRSLTDENVAQLERELRVAKARNASLETQQKIQDDIIKQRRASIKQLKKDNATELRMLDRNRDAYNKTVAVLNKLERLKADGANKVKLNLDGNVARLNIDEAINRAQRAVDDYGKKVQIAVEINADESELAAQEAELAAERIRTANQLRSTEIAEIRKAADARIKLWNDAYKRDEENLRNSYGRQVQDLQRRLKIETGLTTKARKAIEQQIIAITADYGKQRFELQEKQYAQELAFIRSAQDQRIAAMDESFAKERRLLEVEYERRIEDIQRRLDFETELTVNQEIALQEEIKTLRLAWNREQEELENSISQRQVQAELERINTRLDTIKQGTEEEIQLRREAYERQRQLELLQNATLSEELRQNESEINEKWDAIILRETRDLEVRRRQIRLESLQALEESELSRVDASERQKTELVLRHERERLELQLALHEEFGSDMSDVDIDAITNTIDRIDEELERNERPEDIWDLLGLNLSDEKKEAINTSINFVVEQINKLLDAYLEASRKAVDASNERVSAARQNVQNEIDARNAGLAYNLSAAREELAEEQRLREEALADQEKAQKLQEKLQALQQASNLLTASTLIWAQLGFPAALPAIAAMWASYAAVRIKANQLSKSSSSDEEYGSGGYEFIGGGTHASGNDTSLGITNRRGRNMRVERGEFVGVINRRSARKYRNQLPGIWNSINNGSFDDEYSRNSNNMSYFMSPTDVSGVERRLDKIYGVNADNTYVDSDGNTVIVRGNNKRIKRKR